MHGDTLCQHGIVGCQQGSRKSEAQSKSSHFQSDSMQGCGLVAESHVIDESSEWRNFSDKVRSLQDLSEVLDNHTMCQVVH